MRFTRTSNPVLSRQRFDKLQVLDQVQTEPMTLNGTITKTLLLFLCLLITGALSWKLTVSGTFNPTILIWGGAIGGLILALITVFKPKNAPITAPLYAAFEGLFVGSISALYNSFLSGIVIQAVGLTLAILLVLLLLYRSGIIKATSKFKKGVFVATGGVALFYVLNLVFSMFGGGVNLFNLGWMGIGIQLVIVGIASLNLVLDFDMIETNVQSGQPKYVEWYAGFGIMVVS
jgi:uncharacterized YccA/Bax inhibitor family protein